MKNITSGEETSDEVERWKAARQYAALIGNPPRFIRATIHFLRVDREENGNELSFRARSCLLPLLRSEEFKAVLYYTAKMFFPDRLQGQKYDTPRKLAQLFKPDEFIAILSVMYLYRRMKKGCEKESFQTFVKNVYMDWLLNAAVGRAIERIGFADGLLLGAMPQLAQCLLLGVDRKGFKGYRVHVRSQQIPFDIAREQEIWKCNCLQIAVLLAQYIGLGRHYHDPFMLGLPAESLDAVKDNDDVYGARLLQVWVKALKETGEAPDMLHRGEFYPFASEMKRLIEFYNTYKNVPVEELFVEKGKKHLSPQLTPELYPEGYEPTDELQTREEENETAVATLDDLPEEIRNDFPEDIDLDEVLG
ncbi:MAG: hypothetical protein KDD70_06640 [Bdellovibrionales bacterium]|nr:hypothetical protein [Bdellovibrionales bacterium]